MSKDFIPVLMGNDINVYSMARAFYDEYNKKSFVFCKTISGPCQDSDILTLMSDTKIDTQSVFFGKSKSVCKGAYRQNDIAHWLR